jgi:WD40 repeat protein
LPTPPAQGTELALPGGLGTAYENPADPVRLTSLRVGDSRRYVRDPRTGAFADVGPRTVAAEQSPDGRWLASFNSLYAATGDHLAVSFADRLTGERFSVPALGPPYQSLTLAWSRDSARVLLTAQRVEKVNGEDVFLTAGYVIVDVAARTARFVPTGDGEEVKQATEASDGRVKPIEHHAEYRWTPDGRSVISSFLTAEWGQGVRIRDADSGRATRMMHWTGEVQGLADWFSPSGDKFVTGGCATALSACVWKSADASRLHTVPLLKGAGFFGWYDENHLIVVASVQKGQRGVFVTDMSGKPVRVLAMLKAPDDVVVDVRYTRG